MPRREKPAADPPPPERTPFDLPREPAALVPLSPDAAAPPGVEPVAESAACPFCGGVVTPADARCPRCAAKVVPPGAKPMEVIRGNVRTIYVLQALAMLCGLPAIPGLILALTNRGPARGTWLDSHAEWQIDTFWGMFWFWLAGLAVLFFGNYFVGTGLLGHGPALLVMLGAYTWNGARLVKGWTRLSDGDPVTEY